MLETYRECLQDVFDLPALKHVLHGLQTRELDLVEVETPSASPFAASLLFDYIATYMYEDDTPAAERRAQALSLDRDLLRELLGAEELRELLGAEASPRSRRRSARAARTPTSCTTCSCGQAICCEGELDAGFAETLIRERRAFRARSGRNDAVIAAEDAGRYRDAFGVMPPGGLPDAFLEPVEDALERVLLRFARSRGPFTTGEAATRYGLEAAAVEALLARLERQEKLVRGELRPAASSGNGATRRCSGASAARRWRRCGARSSRPSRRRSGVFCRPGTASAAAPRCARRLIPLQALAVPVSLWESEVLPRRVPGYRPEQLDALCASGEAVWVGPVSTASLSSSATTRRSRCSCRRTETRQRRGGCDRRGPRAARRCSGTTCSRRPRWSPPRRSPLSGSSSGPAR